VLKFLIFVRNLVVLLGLISVATVQAAVFDYKVMTAPELKRKMERNEAFYLIHSLSRIEYQIQHIPNSINIPVDEMEYTDFLPQDKQETLVFYCMGKNCKYSEHAAEKAIRMGYTDVYRFVGGIPEWRRYDYPMVIDKSLDAISVKKLRAKEAHELIQAKKAFVLDVRPFFWKGTLGYIKGSVNIPLLELDKFVTILPKNQPIIISDSFMKQSVSAAKYLTSRGFNITGVLRGGINLWEKANFEVTSRDQVMILDIESGDLMLGGGQK